VDVVDARSGRTVRVGEVVRYPPGPDGRNDDWRLLSIERANPFGSAVLVVRHESTGAVARVPCPVRWAHRGRLLPVIIAPT
jgi:hypothetical protein